MCESLHHSKKITNKVYFPGHRKTSSVSFEPISGAHLTKNYASFWSIPRTTGKVRLEYDVCLGGGETR